MNFTQDFVVGGISAIIAKTVVAPIERVKILLQLQEANKQISPQNAYKGIIDCLIRIPKEQGFLSFWRGNLTNIIMYFPAQSLNFAFKGVYKNLLGIEMNEHTPFWRFFGANLIAGGAAGATSLCIVFPLDYARTRIVADIGKSDKDRHYTSITDCIRKTIKSDGLLGLYKGFFVLVQGIFIYRAVYFGLFDTAKGIMCDPKTTPPYIFFIIAQGSTTISGLISYPFDTLGRRMMMQNGLGKHELLYKNALDCAIKIYKKEGWHAFFKGGFTNILRGTGSALVLVFVEELNSVI